MKTRLHIFIRFSFAHELMTLSMLSIWGSGEPRIKFTTSPSDSLFNKNVSSEFKVILNPYLPVFSAGQNHLK